MNTILSISAYNYKSFGDGRGIYVRSGNCLDLKVREEDETKRIDILGIPNEVRSLVLDNSIDTIRELNVNSRKSDFAMSFTVTWKDEEETYTEFIEIKNNELVSELLAIEKDNDMEMVWLFDKRGKDIQIADWLNEEEKNAIIEMGQKGLQIPVMYDKECNSKYAKSFQKAVNGIFFYEEDEEEIYSNTMTKEEIFHSNKANQEFWNKVNKLLKYIVKVDYKLHWFNDSLCYGDEGDLIKYYETLDRETKSLIELCIMITYFLEDSKYTFMLIKNIFGLNNNESVRERLCNALNENRYGKKVAIG